MKPPRSGPLTFPLRALALAYGSAVHLRNRYYQRSGATTRVSVAVISVGNLTVGGTGKTPVVEWLARQLLGSGRRPAVVSRGYGGTAGRGPLVVSHGDGPTLGADVCGDEPRLLALRLHGVPVIVGSDRVRGAHAARELGCNVVVLDDGFQHRRLARDVDLVLLDATRPFDNGRLLPAGALREPPTSLARADLILLTRAAIGSARGPVADRVRRYNAHAPILGCSHRRVGFLDAQGRPVDRPVRAVVFCAIGSPESFLGDVRAEGVEIVELTARRDHHRFHVAELTRLGRTAARHDAALLTTEKDLARLPERLVGAAKTPIRVLRIEADPHDPAALLAAIERRIDGERAP